MSTMRNKTLGMIMAGGPGKKLEVLTSDVRAQSAVPFGGKYRIIDFVLSNFFNSDIKKIILLTQHKSYSLVEHIEENWTYRFGSKDEYIRLLGPMPPHWQKGTADSVYQNVLRIKIEGPDLVAVFAGDHIYRMDIRRAIEFHQQNRAHLTICALRYPVKKAAGQFGTIQRDADGRLLAFEEKSSTPAPIPGDEERVWVSMGNYIFNREVLIDALEDDSRLSESESRHDFAHDIIPALLAKEDIRIFVYEFTSHYDKPGSIKEPGYWRDIGSVDSYYDTSMDLVADNPLFDLYDTNWPIYSINTDNLPPPKFFGAPGGKEKTASHSLFGDGCILKECSVEKSIISPNVEILEGSKVRSSIIFDEVNIGKNCIIEKAIIDKNVWVPDGTVIAGGKIKLATPSSSRGKSTPRREKAPDQEEQRGIFKKLVHGSHSTESGIVVIPRYYDVKIYQGTPLYHKQPGPEDALIKS